MAQELGCRDGAMRTRATVDEDEHDILVGYALAPLAKNRREIVEHPRQPAPEGLVVHHPRDDPRMPATMSAQVTGRIAKDSRVDLQHWPAPGPPPHESRQSHVQRLAPQPFQTRVLNSTGDNLQSR